MSLVSPLLHSPATGATVLAVTFPMAAEGHGLACSSHGFPKLGCAAVLLNMLGEIERADLLLVVSCYPVPLSSVWG